jgi:hypothetical protein
VKRLVRRPAPYTPLKGVWIVWGTNTPLHIFPKLGAPHMRPGTVARRTLLKISTHPSQSFVRTVLRPAMAKMPARNGPKRRYAADLHMTAPCDRGRTDGWHLARSRSLSASRLEWRVDGSYWIYREI